jgi:formamidopyrimidine-DNA glycosylase
MPELPEVENVRLGLLNAVVGRKVDRVTLRRADIVHGKKRPTDLLRGQHITRIGRLGKQLALVGDAGPHGRDSGHEPCVCIHLGMTGSLRYYPPGEPFKPDKHTHVIWRMAQGGQMAFRDPRRFGGLWTFASFGDLAEQRWSHLGEDALTITPARLHAKLCRTQRPIKAALLDQSVVAGLGNIYVDELLFGCHVSPLRPACEVGRPEVRHMVRRMRRLLHRAIGLGGSTLRDYVDARGRSGGFQNRHTVYGRSGQLCLHCGVPLTSLQLAGRTTVYCEQCQH